MKNFNSHQRAPKSLRFAPKFQPPPPKSSSNLWSRPQIRRRDPKTSPPPPLKKAPKRTELPQICPISLELQHLQNPPKKPPIAPKFGTSKIRPPYNSNPPPGFLHAAPKSEDFDPKFTPPPPLPSPVVRWLRARRCGGRSFGRCGRGQRRGLVRCGRGLAFVGVAVGRRLKRVGGVGGGAC